LGQGWSNYLSLAGAVIGWTRGTGLMKGNNLLAVGIEQLGVRTFTTQEICFNCIGLLHPKCASSLLFSLPCLGHSRRETERKDGVLSDHQQ